MSGKLTNLVTVLIVLAGAYFICQYFASKGPVSEPLLEPFPPAPASVAPIVSLPIQPPQPVPAVSVAPQPVVAAPAPQMAAAAVDLPSNPNARISFKGTLVDFLVYLAVKKGIECGLDPELMGEPSARSVKLYEALASESDQEFLTRLATGMGASLQPIPPYYYCSRCELC